MKILIVRNRFKKKLNWTKGIEYFSKNTPIQLEIEEVSTDWDLTFRHVSNDKYEATQNIIVTDYYDKLRSIAPEGKYDAVCLVYGNDAPGIRVSATESTPLYPDTDVMQVVKETDGGKTFNHEIFHVLFYKLARKGILLKDCMDTYKNDKSLDLNIDSNRNDALKLLAPYWNTLLNKKPVVTITRNYDDGVQTLGILKMPGLTCNTLERPWKNNASNISCIPKGSYDVKWTFSTKFMRYTYEVQSVPNRSGIRFHKGNFFTDIAGCILLGNGYKDINKDGRLDIIGSTIIINIFETLLNKQDFKLIIN